MEVCAAKYTARAQDKHTSSPIYTFSGMVRCTLIIHVTSVQLLGTTVKATGLGMVLWASRSSAKQAELGVVYWLSRRYNEEAEPERP
jgi:hypothetical protein